MKPYASEMLTRGDLVVLLGEIAFELTREPNDFVEAKTPVALLKPE